MDKNDVINKYRTSIDKNRIEHLLLTIIFTRTDGMKYFMI